MKSVPRLHRSSAIQAYRDLLVRDFHPLVIRAARAHALLQTWLNRFGRVYREVVLQMLKN